METLVYLLIVVLLVAVLFLLFALRGKSLAFKELLSKNDALAERVESIKREINELVADYDDLCAENKRLDNELKQQVSATNKANGKNGALVRQVNQLRRELGKKDNKPTKNEESNGND